MTKRNVCVDTRLSHPPNTFNTLFYLFSIVVVIRKTLLELLIKQMQKKTVFTSMYDKCCYFQKHLEMLLLVTCYDVQKRIVSTKNHHHRINERLVPFFASNKYSDAVSDQSGAATAFWHLTFSHLFDVHIMMHFENSPSIDIVHEFHTNLKFDRSMRTHGFSFFHD